MKILLDECVDWRLKLEFGSLDIKSVQDMGWQGRTNGELLELASNNGFTVLISVDKKLPHQLNLTKYPLSLVILNTERNTLSYLRPLASRVVAMIESMKPGKVYEIKD